MTISNREKNPALMELVVRLSQLKDFAITLEPECTISVLTAAVLITLLNEIKAFYNDDEDILPFILYMREYALKQQERHKPCKEATHLPHLTLQ